MKNFDAEYWQNRYIQNETGWDTQKITQPLKEYIDQLNNKELKILIPGAGNGYEYEYLLNEEFKNVTVLDIAQQPLQNIKRRVVNCNINQLICDDFLIIMKSMI